MTAPERAATRPLPELTPATEWFWTSGADGVLRVQGCTDCGTLVHPPVPICPSCRSRAWEPTPVSGRGTVVGVTVNAHPWLPGLRPDDVDLALVYDGFTFNAISWLEGLGFCGFGEAQEWLDGGRRIALDGQLPVNPHGGQLSEGRTHGFGFLYEAVTQLRHDAGERQVTDAMTAVVTSGGGTPSGVLLLQRDRA